MRESGAGVGGRGDPAPASPRPLEAGGGGCVTSSPEEGRLSSPHPPGGFKPRLYGVPRGPEIPKVERRNRR